MTENIQSSRHGWQEKDRPVLHEPSSRGDAIPPEVVQAAINWSVKLDYGEVVPETRQAFERWLQADPLHQLARQRIDSLRNGFAGVPSRLALDVLQTADAKLMHRRRAAKLLSLAGVALMTGWVVRDNTPWQRVLADASTAAGEQRTLHLTDGTVIMLNTDSAISADLSGEQRIVGLRRGEMRVTTGPDTDVANRLGDKRPFWVHTPFGRLRAIGTRFVVRLEPDSARISVQDGAVALYSEALAHEDHAPIIVHAGESRLLSSNGTFPVPARGFDEDGWTDGVIAGTNIRLGELIAELSRYRFGRIVCDERIADRIVSGIFQIRNTDQALQFLSQTQPVRVVYRTRFWVKVMPDDHRQNKGP